MDELLNRIWVCSFEIKGIELCVLHENKGANINGGVRVCVLNYGWVYIKNGKMHRGQKCQSVEH